MNKPPPNSLYSKLTEEQRSQLYDWILTLGFSKTKERLALAEPDGFGINTSLSCLHRFYVRYANETDTVTIAEAAQLKKPLPAQLFPLVEQAAHAGAFRLSTAPPNTGSFAQLSQWISAQQSNDLKRQYLQLAEQTTALAQKKTALAERRLKLDREKFETNVAQLALEHAASLQRVVALDDRTIQERIREAREIIYGPTDLPSQPAGPDTHP